MSRAQLIAIIAGLAVLAVAAVLAVTLTGPGETPPEVPLPDEATPEVPQAGQVRPGDPALAVSIPESPYQVIQNELVVLLKEGEDADSFIAALTDEGVTVIGTVPRFRIVQIEIPAERRGALRASLAENPAVEAVSHQILFEPKAGLDDPVFANDDPWDDWGLQAIGAPAAWDITRGSPEVVIAVVDTGIRLSHEELRDKVVVAPASVYDEAGAHLGDAEELYHGTHVAVLAAGAGDNGVGTSGVCPDCALMPIQVDTYLSGMLWGIATALDYGAWVINLSMGPSESDDYGSAFMDPARRDDAIAVLEEIREDYLVEFGWLMEATYAEGANLVVAAGNEAVPGDLNPFCASIYTLCVGNAGRREDGTVAPWVSTNYGYMVRVSAPGTDMYSAVAEADDSYDWADGTSMASPMVAGSPA